MLQIFEKEASTEFHLSMLGIVEDSSVWLTVTAIERGFFSNSRLEVRDMLTKAYKIFIDILKIFLKHLHKFEASNS